MLRSLDLRSRSLGVSSLDLIDLIKSKVGTTREWYRVGTSSTVLPTHIIDTAVGCPINLDTKIKSCSSRTI